MVCEHREVLGACSTCRVHDRVWLVDPAQKDPGKKHYTASQGSYNQHTGIRLDLGLWQNLALVGAKTPCACGASVGASDGREETAHGWAPACALTFTLHCQRRLQKQPLAQLVKGTGHLSLPVLEASEPQPCSQAAA